MDTQQPTMDTNTISKKELLELTGISYGQLYRWKRKRLIPEEWFIRKSAFTGQETFFPREKIMARIDRIKNMKDDLSLDDLASMFSPSPTTIQRTADELIAQNIISKAALDVFQKFHHDSGPMAFDMILQAFIVHKALASGDVSLDEAGLIMQTLAEYSSRFQEKDYSICFLRKLGVATCCLAASPADIVFESGTRIVVRFTISSCIEELKLILI